VERRWITTAESTTSVETVKKFFTLIINLGNWFSRNIIHNNSLLADDEWGR
jgi:hypothetical protein